MYVGKIISFFVFCICSNRGCFQLLLQRLCLVWKPPLDSPSITAGLHVSLTPSSSFIRGSGSISLTTLSPFLPPTRLLSFSLLALGWSAAWGFKGGSREGGLERTGGREETWKEGAGERKRKGASRGGVGKREKTPESEAMIWLLPLSSGEGREECTNTKRARKNGREWKRESLLTWPQGALSSLSFFLPLFITFYTNCPHTRH